MLKTLLHHPHRLWVRRALFQVHLWLGVLLSLYVAIIGLSGSVLVFEEEIRHAMLQGTAQVLAGETQASISQVMQATQKHFPGQTISFVTLPSHAEPRWSIFLQDEKKTFHFAFANPSATHFEETHQSVVDWVKDLHIYLLMGVTGFIVNCLAGFGLLLLAITGVLLWWPGIRIWTRGLWINLRRNWKRITYDAHNAAGIWTLLIVSWWGMTAVYFLLPQQVAAVVGHISHVEGMKQPETPKVAESAQIAPLEAVIASAQAASPGTLSGFAPAAKPGGPVTVYVERGAPGDFSHRDIDTIDGHTARVLTIWHYGENKTLGDWFLWLMHPLHFGTLWGLPVKILWFLLGFSLPVLSLTGLLMYWNRYLGKRWAALRTSAPK